MNVKRMKWAGYTACISALLYALPHFWWGLGVPLAFPGDFDTAPNDFWAQAIGFWVMGGLSVFAAMFALAFSKSWGNRIPRWLLVVPAWIGSIGLSVWGFSYFVLQFQFAIGRVQSTPAFAAQDANPMAAWGYVWYGLFLVWGISLGIAAHYARKLLQQP